MAHPDDETLWAGGTILSHPDWNWYIVSLCRGSDTDRAPRFYKTLSILNSGGVIGNLDDGPDQNPLDEDLVEESIINLIPNQHFDLIISHNPTGEYTRHIRHNEVSRAVIRLWCNNNLFTNELWTFAYEDGGGKYFPKPVKKAHIYNKLTASQYLTKQRILTETYGFEKNSFEARTSSKYESFWKFDNSSLAYQWLKKLNSET